MKFGLAKLQRAATAFAHDVIVAIASFFIALFLRLGDAAVYYINDSLILAVAIYTAVCASVFWFTGLYRGIWRYASLNDVFAIVRAVTLALLIFLAVTFMITRLEAVPRSTLFINWFVLVFMLSAPRMVYRVFKDQGFNHLLERSDRARVPVLLIGVGDSAELFIREMARDPAAPYEVLGIIDNGNGKSNIGLQVRGISVLGTIADLPRELTRLSFQDRKPQRLILTRRLEREAMERLLDLADAAGMTIARLPRLTDFAKGVTGEEPRGGIEVRPIAIEDLLGRTQAKLDRRIMRRLIDGRRVLVTGAGGSIGAELVRQIAGFSPARITLLDNAEYLL